MSYLNSILLSKETLPVNVSANKVNLSELCRTCLCDTTANDMNNKTLCIVTANGKLLPLYQFFEVATGHKVKRWSFEKTFIKFPRKFDFNSTLPHRICHTCLELLKISYTIRTQSQRAENIIECARLVRNEVGTTPTDIVTNMNTVQVEDELNPANRGTQNQMNDRAFDNLELNRECLSNERVGSESNSSVIFIVPNTGEGLKETSTSNEEPAECMFCQKSFPNHIEVLLHYKTCPEDLEPDPRYQSEVPATCFKTPDKPKKTIRGCTKIRDQQQKCMRMPKSKIQSEAGNDLTSHKQQYHCPNCEQKFLQVTELREHMLTHTNNDTDEFYYCIQCAKQWTTKQGWILHMNQHQIEEDKRNRQLSE